jgi:uncharacterized protein
MLSRIAQKLFIGSTGTERCHEVFHLQLYLSGSAMPGVLWALRESVGDGDAWDPTKVRRLLACARGKVFSDIALDLGEDLMLVAALTNEVDIIRVLIYGFGVGTVWESPCLPTCTAAFEGHVEALEVLLDSGVPQFSLHAKNRWRRTPIHAACQAGRLEAVELLLARGARTNRLEKGERNPASLTIIYGHDACLRALLLAGADPNASCAVDQSHYTLVELAALYKRPVAVAMLLKAQAGRSVDAMSLGRTLSISSNWHGSRIIPVMLLNAGADIGFVDDEFKRPPFFYAARNFACGLVRLYVGMYGQPDFDQWDYWSAEISPIPIDERVALKLLRLLLRVGLNTRIEYDKTPVWTRATICDHESLMKLLVRTGMLVSSERIFSSLSPLSSAAFRKARHCVDLLIAAGADVNGRQSSWHPLVGAMLINDKKIMEKLLAAGSRIDALTRINATPLQQYPFDAWNLAKEGFLPEEGYGLGVFKHLCRRGDVNDTSPGGRSAFYQCAIFGLSRELKLLINERCADIDRQQPGAGYTPLMGSIFSDSIECCMSLLEAGADLTVRTTASTVLNVSDVDMIMEPGMDALLFAALLGRIDFIAKFVERGVDLSSCDDGGRNAVWLALHGSADLNAVYNAEAAFDLLLYNGAPIDCCEAKTGLRNIHVSAKEGCFRALAVLATNGADVNSTDSAGNTTLHWAVLGSHSASPYIATMVREFGADVNAKNKYGETALHIAARRCAGDDVSALLDIGCEVDAQDELGRTPVMLACGASPAEGISAEDDDNGGSVKRKRHLPSNIVQMLVERGASVSLLSARGMRALHFASLSGHVSICRYLFLCTRTRSSVRSNCGRTPLHLACRHGHAAVAELLISKGAQVNARDKKGRTPLFEAASRGYSDCVSVLLKSNADASAVCDSGQTPLSEATRKRMNSAVRVLASKPIPTTVRRGGDLKASSSGDEVVGNLCLVGGSDSLLNGSCM